MRKKSELLIANEFHNETIEILDKTYSTHHLWQCNATDKELMIADLEGKCSAAASASWFCDDVIYDLKSLEIISCFGVGVDAIDFEKTQKNNIRVTNTPDVLNKSVADIALALILATTRNIVNADKFVRKNLWPKGAFPFGSSIDGKTLGIAGFGRIGNEIAIRAQSFGLNIAYHNRNQKDLPFSYFSSIEELAAASDILLCMLPGGENTKHAIDAAVFRNLGATGIFLNVGRGTSVDEDALIAALRDKQIAGAGLDVYADEPNVPEGLLDMDNVVLLPHIGSATVETRRAMGKLTIDNLEAYFANKPLLTEVK